MRRSIKNCEGLKFGRLTVLRRDENKKYNVICKCNCGNVVSVRFSSLTKNNKPTVSCGCLHKEIMRKIGLKTIRENAQSSLKKNLLFNTNFHMIESSKVPKNNTTGYKGVSFDSSRGMYESYIGIHGKRIYLGRFKDLNKAIEARKIAEDRIYKPIIEQKYQTEGV